MPGDVPGDVLGDTLRDDTPGGTPMSDSAGNMGSVPCPPDSVEEGTDDGEKASRRQEGDAEAVQEDNVSILP